MTQEQPTHDASNTLITVIDEYGQTHYIDIKNMSHILRDFQGNDLIITNEQAKKIANIAKLIEIDDEHGQTHYINQKNIASITPLNDNA